MSFSLMRDASYLYALVSTHLGIGKLLDTTSILSI